jgi:hypothetical protein
VPVEEGSGSKSVVLLHELVLRDTLIQMNRVAEIVLLRESTYGLEQLG